MSAIFLSYSRTDRPTAQIFAEALEAEGLTVWWDKVLKAGQTYDEVTEQMLRDAGVVVVLWSQTSVKSKWVRAEATLGQRNATVIPAMIEDADRPIMFELTQTANLIGWQGDRTNENWRNFIADIRGAIAVEPSSEATPSANETPDKTIEATFWTSIKDSSDPSEFEAYLSRYPNGHFTDLARSRLSGLTTQPSQPVSAPVAQPATANTARADAPRSKSKLPLMIGGVAAVAAIVGAVMIMTQSDDELASDQTESTPIASTEASCDVCPQMVSIPSGTFLIGSPSTEAGRVGNEGPQSSVQISAFRMSRSEITQDQWAECVADGECRETIGKSGAFPAGMVSWDDANTYANWLSSKTGQTYRLPTEAEWEYAARAGSTTAYWWGDNFDASRIVRGGPARVTDLQENPFGLAGMLGNVREWVADCYINNYSNRPSDGRAVESGNCDLRVIRGGSYELGASEHRSANRARISRSTTSPAIGFRVVQPDLSEN